MARASSFSFVPLIFLIFSCSSTSIFGEDDNYVKRVDAKKMKMLKEKTSHFRLYWHDIVVGPNPTSVAVVKKLSNSSTFGLISMIHNPLTVGPKLTSKMVGRAEGLYADAGEGVLMIMNFVINDGKYNGSTFTILGRNHVPSKVREMPVIGGSGLFRFARGYAQAHTIELNDNGNAVVEYNAYVIHY